MARFQPCSPLAAKAGIGLVFCYHCGNFIPVVRRQKQTESGVAAGNHHLSNGSVSVLAALIAMVRTPAS